MNETEKWYQSRGVWGAAGTILMLIGGMFGYQLSGEELEAFIVFGTGMGGIFTTAVALYGRIKASKRIE
jgi:hypothetical protein